MSNNGPVVFSSIEFAEALWQDLRAAIPGVRVHQVPTRDPAVIEASIGEAEVACVFPEYDFDPAMAPRLRWLLTASAGVDALIGKRLWQSQVQIVNASGIHAYSIAELVFGMVLSLRHRLPFFHERQQARAWSQSDRRARSAGELVGLTLGILGYGSIGRQVARVAGAFGMRVIATTLDPALRRDTGFALPGAGDADGSLPEVLAGPDFQEQLLRESDVVVVAVPSCPATRRLIGEAELRAMKPSAILVNIARGAVVDEAALIRALREGWIAGAGLDVFEVEPLPGDSPLWQMDNVIVTPHIAGDSPEYWRRLMMLLTENIRRELAGLPLLNVVDKRLGF